MKKKRISTAEHNEKLAQKLEAFKRRVQTPQIIRDLSCFTGDHIEGNTFVNSIDKLMTTMERSPRVTCFRYSDATHPLRNNFGGDS